MNEFAFVTRSYRRDLAMCRELCASIDEHMPGTQHYLLIDRQDFALFSPLEAENRSLVDCSALLPQFKQIPCADLQVWWRWPFRLVRGWIYQQLAKIAYVAQMDENAAIVIDSDARLLAPIDLAQIQALGQVKIHRNKAERCSAQQEEWHRIAQGLIGRQVTGYRGFDYIGPAVVWSPNIVKQMIARIEDINGAAWFDCLIRNFRFSEYIIYGNFVEQLASEGGATLTPGGWEFCHASWHYDLSSTDGINSFVAAVRPEHSCLLIQSNLKLPNEKRAEIIARIERKLRRP